MPTGSSIVTTTHYTVIFCVLILSLSSAVFFYKPLTASFEIDIETQSGVSSLSHLANTTDVPFVKNLDFKRFMGLWYNIASLPNLIESHCKCPQVVDTLQSDLVIDLSQSCLLFGKNITSNSKAVATVPGYGNWTNYNFKLPADYWIIEIDENNQWVILGQPSRKGLWIMSRQYEISKELLQSLIKKGEGYGFDLKKIEYQDQSCHTKKHHVTANNKILSQQSGQIIMNLPLSLNTHQEMNKKENDKSIIDQNNNNNEAFGATTAIPNKYANDLPFAKHMSFEKFMGTWYNIASLPNLIEKHCKCAQTTDTLESDLVISLSQSCLIFGKNITSSSKAVATIPGYGNWTNVMGPVHAPYWIIEHDQQSYQWAVIGQPSRKGFWIMSRNYEMDKALLNSLIDKATKQWGFNLKQLEYEDQVSCRKQTKLNGNVRLD